LTSAGSRAAAARAGRSRRTSIRADEFCQLSFDLTMRVATRLKIADDHMSASAAMAGMQNIGAKAAIQ
jgi:hypothetical protein